MSGPDLNSPNLNRIGLGLAALGRPGYLNLGHGDDLGLDKTVPALRAQTFAMLDAAWAAGLRTFDAARSYGLAEQFLGDWRRERGHGQRDKHGDGQAMTIGSKWGYTYVADWRTDAETHEVKTHDRATLDRQWPETLRALGQAPDLYLIHSATLDTGVLDDRAVLARLAELAARGVRVGLSTSGPRQADTLRRALAVRVDGHNPLSAVQATWNLLEPSAGAALAEAHAAGWTVVVKEAVANGRLTRHGLRAQGDVPAALAHAAQAAGVTPDAVALAAALAQPWADVVLSGAVITDQLAANLKAVEVQPDLHALAELRQMPEHYWQTRSGLAWT